MNYYLIATMEGGVQEKPEFTYRDKAMVVANTEEDAKKIYKDYVKLSYWFSGILAVKIGIFPVKSVGERGAITLGDVDKFKLFIKSKPQLNTIVRL